MSGLFGLGDGAGDDRAKWLRVQPRVLWKEESRRRVIMPGGGGARAEEDG